jgi:hypothetical protein
MAWCITLAGSWILEAHPDFRAAILRRRFQFNLRALLLLTAGIALVCGAEMAMASPPQWHPSAFLRWFVLASLAHITMFVAGGMSTGWAVGMPTGRRCRYAAYGACIAALLILSRVAWFVSDPNNWFPSQGRMEELARRTRRNAGQLRLSQLCRSRRAVASPRRQPITVQQIELRCRRQVRCWNLAALSAAERLP